ncbi:hypothetical protein NDU88_002837 [Pleurodeles waltl]|uniref:Uncharacterized protein n=1 Tax=Pleurodeles waltl TaxID=8319 RepID=A0AAV7W3Z2_PLEWA|nr:hypothetical protein NDU88_002837 [Pleurodeles waltl]
MRTKWEGIITGGRTGALELKWFAVVPRRHSAYRSGETLEKDCARPTQDFKKQKMDPDRRGPANEGDQIQFLLECPVGAGATTHPSPVAGPARRRGPGVGYAAQEQRKSSRSDAVIAPHRKKSCSPSVLWKKHQQPLAKAKVAEEGLQSCRGPGRSEGTQPKEGKSQASLSSQESKKSWMQPPQATHKQEAQESQ